MTSDYGDAGTPLWITEIGWSTRGGGKSHLVTSKKGQARRLKKVMKRLIEHGLRFDIRPEAKEFLIDKGTNADFGARPLRRAIEQHVEDPLSEEILRGAFKGKDLIKISVKQEEGAEKHLFFEAFTTNEGAGGAEGEKQLVQSASDAT